MAFHRNEEKPQEKNISGATHPVLLATIINKVKINALLSPLHHSCPVDRFPQHISFSFFTKKRSTKLRQGFTQSQMWRYLGFNSSSFIVVLPPSADVAEDGYLAANRHTHYKARTSNVQLAPSWETSRSQFPCFFANIQWIPRFGVSCESLKLTACWTK